MKAWSRGAGACAGAVAARWDGGAAPPRSPPNTHMPGRAKPPLPVTQHGQPCVCEIPWRVLRSAQGHRRSVQPTRPCPRRRSTHAPAAFPFCHVQDQDKTQAWKPTIKVAGGCHARGCVDGCHGARRSLASGSSCPSAFPLPQQVCRRRVIPARSDGRQRHDCQPPALHAGQRRGVRQGPGARVCMCVGMCVWGWAQGGRCSWRRSSCVGLPPLPIPKGNAPHTLCPKKILPCSHLPPHPTLPSHARAAHRAAAAGQRALL